MISVCYDEIATKREQKNNNIPFAQSEIGGFPGEKINKLLQRRHMKNCMRGLWFFLLLGSRDRELTLLSSELIGFLLLSLQCATDFFRRSDNGVEWCILQVFCQDGKMRVDQTFAMLLDKQIPTWLKDTKFYWKVNRANYMFISLWENQIAFNANFLKQISPCDIFQEFAASKMCSTITPYLNFLDLRRDLKTTAGDEFLKTINSECCIMI